MKGILKILKQNDDLTFSSSFEYSGDEYLKALKDYSTFDSNFMFEKKPNNQTKSKKMYLECKCDIMDGLNGHQLNCKEFFDVVFCQDFLKYLTFSLYSDSTDEDFDEEMQEWLYNSNRLRTNSVRIFGVDVLPKKDFYIEIINDNNEVKTLYIPNAFLEKIDKINQFTIGFREIDLIG